MINFHIKIKKFSSMRFLLLRSLMQKKISLQKNLFFWPDGISINFFQKKIKIKKIPGRSLIDNLVLPNYINDIVIAGNLGHIKNLYFKKIYK